MQHHKLKTAVIGVGKMGEMHARIYSELPHSELVAVVDSNMEKAEASADKYKCKAYKDYRDILDKVEAVTISTPTSTHYEIGSVFLRHNIPVLIEKPLATDAREGRKLVDLAGKKNTILAVGHSERCNPVVQAMERMEIEPRFIEAIRVSPYPFRSGDIGVIFDVMIHDIDIILSLIHSPIKKVDAIGVNVIDRMEDICNARIYFENGCIASLTASRLAFRTDRKIRVFSQKAYMSVDFFKKTGIIIKADPNVDVLKWIREKKDDKDFNPLTVEWQKLLKIEELEVDDTEPLRLEQESFLNAVKGQKTKPEVTGEEGLAALECAEKIIRSIQKNQWFS
jgi:predicted dehydrogenase